MGSNSYPGYAVTNGPRASRPGSSFMPHPVAIFGFVATFLLTLAWRWPIPQPAAAATLPQNVVYVPATPVAAPPPPVAAPPPPPAALLPNTAPPMVMPSFIAPATLESPPDAASAGEAPKKDRSSKVRVARPARVPDEATKEPKVTKVADDGVASLLSAGMDGSNRSDAKARRRRR